MKTKLIALAAILAALVPSIGADIAEGASFEVTPDEAEPLLTQGLAKLADAAPATAPKTRATKLRLLTDCALGRANDVVSLPQSEAKAAEDQGIADTSREAVAYAMTLEQNQPKAT